VGWCSYDASTVPSIRKYVRQDSWGLILKNKLFQTFFGELIPLYASQEKKHTSNLPSLVPEKCDKSKFSNFVAVCRLSSKP